MRQHSTSLALAAFLILTAGVGAAHAQEKAKGPSVAGVVKTVSGGTFIVSTGKSDVSFIVDANTHIFARGATTATRAKKSSGEGGLTIADVVHEGDQVTVKYSETGGKFVANDIQVRSQRPTSAQPVK